MDKTSIGNRMKGYESVAKTKLLRRTPVIIRVDGKAFHTFTKQFDDYDKDPFSVHLHVMMTWVARDLVNNIQNAEFAYTQSDEISILLNDWKKLKTDQWFDGNVQKIASIAGAMASTYFNHYYTRQYLAAQGIGISEVGGLALFDARAFNVPKEEVVNYFLWRQQDATRNSIQMVGRHYFSHKQLHMKNVAEIQEMLYAKFGLNWNDLSTWKKRGSCIVRNNLPEFDNMVIDDNPPMFSRDRAYIEQFLKAEE